jgi:outer membrane receptor for ferrienterochelin and colicin
MRKFLTQSFFTALFLLSVNLVKSQKTGTLSGIIVDKTSQKSVSNVSIQILNSTKGTISDSLGKFSISQLLSGAYTIQFKAIGYLTVTKYNVPVTSGNENNILVELEEDAKILNAVTVSSTGRTRTARAATLETPLSVQRLTTEEIKTNPGGNFDISRVIQALPGVGGTAGPAGFRNDIIIRGGAPNENVYYIDGIEIPVINHFSTQGSAGGPAGILNVSFIEEVKLSSSAFDARFNNTLSSVFEFKQKRGNSSHLQGNIRLSGTELATTLEGPLSKNGQTTFLASARRSYLQLLFKAIDLPIRPNFWDFQYKITHQFNKKTTLSLLGVGAIDEFEFAAPKKATPEKLYVLNNNPSIEQWNYTVGATIKHLIKNGYLNLAISRNAFNNQLEKFENNLGANKGEQTLNVNSTEIENKLRYDVNQTFGSWKVSHGIDVQQVSQTTSNNQIIQSAIKDNLGNITVPAVVRNYSGDISLVKFGGFIQAGKRFWNNKTGISAGIRADANNFTTNGMNVLNTLSPRISLSQVLSDKWTFNASIGTYYKIVPYTILGYRNNNNELVNKDADYTKSTHYVAGFEYLPNQATRFTIETFFKQYNQVPISVRNGISLSNQGGDFNVLGNEAVITNGKGRTMGFEFFAQQKLTKRFYSVLSYTYFKSEYTNANAEYTPSSWDNRHLLSLVWGYKFNRNWELGIKLRFQGGVPYTPYDLITSRTNYLTLGSGTLDYSKINTDRLNNFNAGDIRIDKKWYYKKTTLDLFLDISNFYRAKSTAPNIYTFQRTADNSAFATTDNLPIKQNGSNGIPILLNTNDANITPTIGFIVEF